MILSHDLGTTGDKATLVDRNGAVVAAVTVGYPVVFGAGGLAEQDPNDWWTAVSEATVRLLAGSAVVPGDVDVVSFSGQMMGVVPVDGAGEPVRPAIIWADTRSGPQCRAIARSVSMEECYAITGHRLNPTYSLSKTAWLRENEPGAFARTRRVLQAKDWVAFRLTGVMVTDPSDASGTNAYDQRTGTWSDELLGAAGLDPSLFPEIVPSTTVIGTVTTAAALETGLLAGTPVVIGGGDGPTAALGAGIVSAEDGAYAYLGSSSWVSVSADRPLLDPAMRSMTFNHVVPGAYVPTATMQAGGASLQWVTNVLAPGREDRYRTLLAAAAGARAADDGLFFLPYLLGERSPYWNPAARAAFVGLHIDHGPANMTRAVLEGVAFNLNTGLRAFTENGVAVESVAAIGGAAASDLLLDVFADVWDVPVVARTLVDEANSLGAAVVGGVGVGVFDDFGVARTLSAERGRHEPDAARHHALERAYESFLDVYDRLEPVFDRTAADLAARSAR
ncbi:xylulokinase [Curtobacterium sp. MCSS17_015]|uniref:xylulokinase n=1 Tax=Curtobacterium sp. MCSS17_015 TaxID=2175666 RepID=UPI000DA9EC63|nr:xylulokinase [Curtobacterium sp. MCSS17_015]WIB25723.1 xylulokinase [Curtobacterium sp. MCSS17_015]